MARVWRRLAIVVTAITLTVLLVGIGVAVWLYTSGRLATVTADFVQRLSGHQVTIGAITLSSLGTAVFTDVRFHAQLPGWRLEVLCPRMEARVGLRGLFEQRVQHLHLQQLQAFFHPSDDLPPATPPPSAIRFDMGLVPVRRLSIHQGHVQIHWQRAQYVLHRLEVHLQQQGQQHLLAEVDGAVAEHPTTFQGKAQVTLSPPKPAGTMQVAVQHVPLSLLAAFVPVVEQDAQGTLRLEGNLTLQDERLQGTFTTELAEVIARIAGVHIEAGTALTSTTAEVHLAQHTLRIDSQVALQAERLQGPDGFTLSRLTFSTPVHVAYASDNWQLTAQSGHLQGHWRDVPYALQPLNIHVQSQHPQLLQVEVRGTLADTPATLHTVATLDMSPASSSHTGHVTVQELPLSRFVEALPNVLPPGWKVSQGTLAVESDVRLQGTALDSKLTARVDHVVAQGAAGGVDDATVTVATTVQGDTATRTLRVDGGVQLGARQLRATPETLLTDITLASPLHLTAAPDQWRITATPAVRGKTLELKGLGWLHDLALTGPLTVQETSRGVQLQSTPTFTVPHVELLPNAQGEAMLHISDLHGEAPVQTKGTTLEVAITRLRTKTWSWQGAEGPERLEEFTLESAGMLDVQRQQLTVRQLQATVGELGTLSGSGVWQWASQVLQDLHLQLAPTDPARLWQRLAGWLPVALQSWQVAGQTRLTLQCPRLSLQPPWHVPDLQVSWSLQDGAVTAATVAAEHLQGTLQLAVSRAPSPERYSVEGTLALQPFALLIGTVFPALEANRIAPTVTFSATYEPQPALLHLTATGDFGVLGSSKVQGTLRQPLGTPHYDLELHLRDMRAEQFWRTFVHDAGVWPTLAHAAVQGTLNTQLHVRGQPTGVTLQGNVEVRDGSFTTSTAVLQGVSLSLPVQGQYPLPPTAPDFSTLPAAAYGHLHVAHMQLGKSALGQLTTSLALWSDTLWVPESISLALGGGQIVLGPISATSLLQPQRQVQLAVRMQQLDLQQLPQEAQALPVAGIVSGDLPRVQLEAGHLTTEGELFVLLAGGQIRLFDIHGSNLLSAAPTLRGSLRTEQPLSLEQLTRLYPIGEISGTVDVVVTDLTITAGELEAFDLRFEVRERGGEQRGITLRALNNLLFTTASTQVAAGLFGVGDTYRLPYRRFGATATLRNDVLQLRGLYTDRDGTEYFMQAPALGHGVSIVNRTPEHGTSFRAFVQRLRAIILEKPDVQLSK